MINRSRTVRNLRELAITVLLHGLLLIAPIGQHALLPLLLLCMLLRFNTASATTMVSADSAQVNKQRLLVLGTSFTAGYSAMLVGLNNAWYTEEKRTGFHFFNDN